MKGWKVLLCLPEEPMSSAVSIYAPVSYWWGVWTFPKKGCGPLAVFRTRKAARAFVEDRDHSRVVRCEYEPSTHRALWTVDKRFVTTLNELPKDTLLADAVMPLHRDGGAH